MSDSTGSGQGSSSGFGPAQLRQKFRQERDKRLRPDGNTHLDARVGREIRVVPAAFPRLRNVE
jgi:hypothetical protein